MTQNREIKSKKRKMVCDICKHRVKRLVCFEDDSVKKDLALCLQCYDTTTEKGLPKWVDVLTRTNIYGGEHRP